MSHSVVQPRVVLSSAAWRRHRRPGLEQSTRSASDVCLAAGRAVRQITVTLGFDTVIIYRRRWRPAELAPSHAPAAPLMRYACRRGRDNTLRIAGAGGEVCPAGGGTEVRDSASSGSRQTDRGCRTSCRKECLISGMMMCRFIKVAVISRDVGRVKYEYFGIERGVLNRASRTMGE